MNRASKITSSLCAFALVNFVAACGGAPASPDATLSGAPEADAVLGEARMFEGGDAQIGACDVGRAVTLIQRGEAYVIAVSNVLYDMETCLASGARLDINPDPRTYDVPAGDRVVDDHDVVLYTGRSTDGELFKLADYRDSFFPSPQF